VGQAIGLLTILWFVPWWMCLVLSAPLLVDWGVQQWLSRPSTNLRRFLTGLMAGVGEVGLVVLGLRWLFGVLL